MRCHGRSVEYSLTHANLYPLRPRQEIHGCEIRSQRTAPWAASFSAPLLVWQRSPLGGHTTIKLEKIWQVQGKPSNVCVLLLILLPCLITNPCNHPDLANRWRACYESMPSRCSGNRLANIPSCCCCGMMEAMASRLSRVAMETMTSRYNDGKMDAMVSRYTIGTMDATGSRLSHRTMEVIVSM